MVAIDQITLQCHAMCHGQYRVSGNISSNIKQVDSLLFQDGVGSCQLGLVGDIIVKLLPYKNVDKVEFFLGRSSPDCVGPGISADHGLDAE